MYTATYAGIQLENYVNIMNIKRTLLPPRTNFTKDIPAVHGEVYMGYKYAPREISLECYLKATSKEEYIENVRDLAFILDVDTPKRLILGDDAERYCYAVFDGTIDIEKIIQTGQLTINFVCHDPYLYSLEEDVFESQLSNTGKNIVTIENAGTTKAYPIVSVGFENTAHFLQCTDVDGRTVLIGTPPNVDNTQADFDPTVLKDNCEVLTNWTSVGSLDTDREVMGDIVVNGGGYGFTGGNYGSSTNGWHGGARRRNFSPVRDFEVKVKMEHNSKGDLKGTGSGTNPPATNNGTKVKYKVTAEPSLRIREGRGTSYKQIGSLKKGTIVEVSNIEKNWGYVESKKGYISMDYVVKYVEPTPSTASYNYKITASPSLRIRSGRGTNYKQVGSIPKGKTVVVKDADISGGWGKTTYNGKTGYISMQYTSKGSKVTSRDISTLADEQDDKVTAEDRLGRIEVYGYDGNGNKLFKMIMRDSDEYYEYSQPEIEIGSTLVLDDKKTTPAPKTVKVQDEKDKNKTITKKVDSGKFGDWNEFVGWFTVRRRTNEQGKQQWWCQVEKLNSAGKVERSIQTATLINDKYPKGDLTNIVVWFGQYKSNIVVDVMNVNEIYVTNIGNPPKQKENKPIFQKGDVVDIDFGTQEVYTRKGSLMQHLDIGSEFFACPVGESEMIVNSDDKNINVITSIQKKWL